MGGGNAYWNSLKHKEKGIITWLRIESPLAATNVWKYLITASQSHLHPSLKQAEYPDLWIQHSAIYHLQSLNVIAVPKKESILLLLTPTRIPMCSPTYNILTCYILLLEGLEGFCKTAHTNRDEKHFQRAKEHKSFLPRHFPLFTSSPG